MYTTPPEKTSGGKAAVDVGEEYQDGLSGDEVRAHARKPFFCVRMLSPFRPA